MSGQEAALTICGWVVALGLLVIFTRAVELVIAWLKSRIARVIADEHRLRSVEITDVLSTRLTNDTVGGIR